MGLKSLLQRFIKSENPYQKYTKKIPPNTIDPDWIKYTGVTMNQEFISIKTYSGYGMGVADPTVPEWRFPPDVADAELGQAVKEAVNKSRALTYEESNKLGEDSEKRYHEWVDQIKKLYGYKTKRAMFEGMKSCSVNLKDEKLIFRPSNHETLEGWTGEGISKDDYVILPEDCTDEEAGAALRLAFSRCI